MVQVHLDKARAQAVVWVKVKGKAEAEWVVRLLQDRAGIVYVQIAAQQSLMLLDSLVIKETVQSAVRK
jgi:hypothetical protein